MIGATTSPKPSRGKKPTSFWREYSLFIGFSVLVFILMFLLPTPEQLTFRQIFFIDAELRGAQENRTPVLSKLDLKSSESLRKFPTEFGDWSGSDYETADVEAYLNADCVLMRAYSKPGLYLPVFLLILQSELHSSFHPPPVCYPLLGYTIEEEDTVTITIETEWEEGKEWPSITKSPQYRPLDLMIAKKLVIYKGPEEDITERRVVLYFYLKDNQLISNRVTMIRVSALVPLTGSYDDIMNIEREFIQEAFPYMFEIEQREPGQMIIVHLVKSGVGGCLLLAFLFSIPLAILIYPRVRRPRVVAEEDIGEHS